jgi:hypothetical protein
MEMRLLSSKSGEQRMIKIFMFEQMWRIQIGENEGKEVFEFPTLRELIDELETICEIKDNFGRGYEK